MRFFRKSDKTGPVSDAGAHHAPRVEGDIVYDENGRVLFDPTIDMNPAVEPEECSIVPEPAATLERPAVHQKAKDVEADNAALDAPADTSTIDNIAVDYAGEVEDGLEIDMAATQPVVDVTPDRAESRAGDRGSFDRSPLLHKRVNLSELRVDVARISSDIQSGERLYQRAQQRVESLTSFVERAEVDFSLLNRLEPENRRLKARNRVLEAENESSTHATRRLESELAEAQEDVRTTKANLEAARSRLAAATSHLGDRDREIARITEQVEQVALKMERSQTSVEVESRENVLLREQIGEMAGRMDEVTSERMELAKIVESLKIDCDDFRAQREQALNEVNDLRMTLASAHKVNGEMKSQMVTLHEEIKGFKTQYEFNVISREDRITNLEARIGDLSKQLMIKEDVAKSALTDVAQLRKARSAQDLERERLERLIEAQQRQLDEAQGQIRRSSDNMADLDQRYNDVAAALSMHQKRLTPDTPVDADSAAPLAPPPPFEEAASSAPMELYDEPVTRPGRDADALSPDNVEDMIMDYKLGLRSQIG